MRDVLLKKLNTHPTMRESLLSRIVGCESITI